MEDRFADFKNKRLIIPHQLTDENISSIALPSWFIPKKFNLLHAGNLMKQRDPFPLIAGFVKFLEKNPEASADARLLLVGSASYYLPQLNKAENEIKELFVSKGYISYEIVLKLQKEIAVNIILESNAEISPFLPGKFPHCIDANKPILHLGPQKSEVRRLLGANHEYFSKAIDVSGIAENIEDLYFNWKNNQENFALNRLDLEIYLSEVYLKEQIENLS